MLQIFRNVKKKQKGKISQGDSIYHFGGSHNLQTSHITKDFVDKY